MLEETRNTRICLLGASVEGPNRGVSALAASLVQLFSKADPHSRILLLIGSRTGKSQAVKLSGRTMPVEVVNYRLSPRARARDHLFWIFTLACLYRLLPSNRLRAAILRASPWLRAIRQGDLIGDIRGGDSFSDYYGLLRLIIGSLPAIIVLLLKKELVLLPQTYGPYRSAPARLLARWQLDRAAQIISRDRQSIGVVESLLGGRDKNIFICPDVAFVLEAVRPPHLQIKPPLELKREVPCIGLNVNGLLYNGGYNRRNMFGLKSDYRKTVAVLGRRLLDNTEAHLLLVPHTFAEASYIDNDLEACRLMWRSLSAGRKNRVHLIEHAYDQSEIKWLIGRCAFFVGSRMHACIAALSQGVPTVGIAYSRKFSGVFQTAGVGSSVLDARFLSQGQIIERVLQEYQRRAETGRLLRTRRKRIQTEIESTFARLSRSSQKR